MPERIGLAGIHSFDQFWEAIESDDRTIAGELQTSNGLNELIKIGLKGISFDWQDTGTEENYRHAVRENGGVWNLEKPGEFIYFVGDRVIKYFDNISRTENRYSRKAILGDVIPKTVLRQGNFLSYGFVEGHRLSDECRPDIFDLS